MISLTDLLARLESRCGEALLASKIDRQEITIEVQRQSLLDICHILRDDSELEFCQLMDVCGVDYSDYRSESLHEKYDGPRFAVVYHLLSLANNCRLRLRVFLEEDFPVVDSVIDIWASANWFERETFDLFGFVFDGHPDLRRILTDYGFIGHPFRKDFPLSGNVEVTYDEEQGRVVYQPVTIEPRTLVPKTVRDDNRYTPEIKGRDGNG